MMSRVSDTSIGLSWPLRMMVSLILVFTGPRIFSTAWFRVRPCTCSSSSLVMMSLAMNAGLGGGRLVDRRHHLDQAVFHGDFDAEPAELAAGLHLHVAEALRVHVARMRIEPGQHAVDRGFDQLAVVRLLDVVGAHALEHVAEQIELPVGVGGRRLGAGADEDHVAAGSRAASVPRRPPRRGESEKSCASSANLFAFACRPPWAGIDGSPVLSKLDVEHRLAGTCREDSGDMGAVSHHRNGLSGQHELAEID